MATHNHKWCQQLLQGEHPEYIATAIVQEYRHRNGERFPVMVVGRSGDNPVYSMPGTYQTPDDADCWIAPAYRLLCRAKLLGEFEGETFFKRHSEGASTAITDQKIPIIIQQARGLRRQQLILDMPHYDSVQFVRLQQIDNCTGLDSDGNAIALSRMAAAIINTIHQLS